MVIVVVTPAARQQIADLPTPIVARVQRIICRLEAWPDVSGAKPLRGALAGYYRIRTSDYRVQFAVKATANEKAPSGKDYQVTIEKVGHRDGFYE